MKSYFLFALALVFLLPSCVSKKEYQAAILQNNTVTAQLKDANDKNAELQKQIDDFKSSREVALQEFAKYKKECEDTKEDLGVLAGMLNEEYKTMVAIAEKIDAGMADFADKGVDVVYKEGLVFVNMEDNLLYKSGSSSLSAQGKEALGKLAAALNEYPKLKVIVVGNTDDKPFKKGAMDNWTLSTERANGVVRLLRDSYNVDPGRLTAAGKGKYAPIADNANDDGRAKNRRTEIILNPDLRRVWESVKSE